MALKYHPDRNKAPDAAVKFNQVKKAYEVLKNPDHRSIYDALGEEGLKEAIESQNQSFHPFFGFGTVFLISIKKKYLGKEIT